MKYLFLEHTADIKFQAFGKNLEQLFENSFLALKKTISGKIKIKEKIKKEIKIVGMDLNGLLYDFLEEFLYLLEVEDLLVNSVKKIKIQKNNLGLTAIISGDKASNYKIKTHIKAITYNQMFIKKQKEKFVCQVVLDV